MFYFTQQMAPSTRAHLETQMAFAAELSKQWFGAFQRFNELNIQIAQSALQDTLSTTREVLSARGPIDALSVAAAQMPPAAERLRNYQQQLANIAARTQVELSRTAEAHVPQTSRTASAVADEVARRAAEATQQASQRQRAVYEKVAAQMPRPDSGRSGGAASGANVH